MKISIKGDLFVAPKSRKTQKRPIICVRYGWILFCFHPIKQYRKKTWAEPKHLNKHNKVQYMTCYESLMSQIKKSVSILANSDEFNWQLWHVNTLLDWKPLVLSTVLVVFGKTKPALEFKLIWEYLIKASLFIHLYLQKVFQ